MSCSECGEVETTYNEKIGETECVGCGLILITELFEETVSAYDKALRSRVEVVYIKAFRKHLFSQYSLEDRATALVYYLLRENSIPYTMKEIAKEYNSNVKVAYVIVKRLSNAFGRTGVTDTRAFAEKYATQLDIGIDYVGACGLVADYFDRVVSERDENLTSSTSAAVCWIVAKSQYKQLTQKQIATVSRVY